MLGRQYFNHFKTTYPTNGNERSRLCRSALRLICYHNFMTCAAILWCRTRHLSDTLKAEDARTCCSTKNGGHRFCCRAFGRAYLVSRFRDLEGEQAASDGGRPGGENQQQSSSLFLLFLQRVTEEDKLLGLALSQRRKTEEAHTHTHKTHVHFLLSAARDIYIRIRSCPQRHAEISTTVPVKLL